MPIYTVELDGKTFEVEGTRPPTEADVRALLPTQSAPSAPGGGLKDTLLSGAKGALELLGRPGEFVSGTLAGGVGRGWAALVEPNLRDSKIQESMSNTMKERGVLVDSPKTRAVLGFAADVVTDPLNLLGGAGVVRSGLLKGLKGAGVTDDVARAALGLPIGEAFQKTVVPAVKQGLAKTVAATPVLKSLVPHADLATVAVPKLNLSAKDLKQGAEAAQRAGYGVAEATATKFVKDHALTMDERVLLSTARALPDSPEAAAAMADPRLRAALEDLNTLLSRNLAGDIEAQMLPTLKELPVSPKLQERLAKLSLDEKAQLARTFTPVPGQAVPTGPLSAPTELGLDLLPPHLQKLARAIVKDTRRDGSFFADLHTMQVGEDGVLRVSTAIPNYVPQQMPASAVADANLIGASKSVSPKLKAAEERSLSWREHVRAGGVQDVGELLANRLKDSARAKASRDLLTQYAQELGSTTAKTGYRTLKATELERMPETLRTTFEGLHLPTAVADDIERVQIRLRDPKAMEGLGARGLKLFKTMATTLGLPAHQATNFLGNVANMYAAGGMRVDEVFRSYTNALKTLDAPNMKVGAFLAPVKVGDTVYEGKDLIDLAVRKGVVGEMSGFASEFAKHPTLTPLAQKLTGQAWSPLNPDAKVYQKLRDFNQNWVEDPAKLALFHWKLSKGASVDEAAATVRKVLFDYAELTDVEKSLRQVVPFYTWTRKNVPLQLATMATSPARLSNQRRLLDLAREWSTMDEAQDVPEERLPGYLKGPGYAPLPGWSTDKGEPIYTNWRLPVMDLEWLDAEEFAKKTGFSLTPPLRAALEALVLGHRAGSPNQVIDGRPVDAGLLGRLTGLGTAPGPDGKLKQKASTRWAQELLPLPFASTLRTVDEGGTAEGIPLWLEAALRAMGQNPVAVTPEIQKRGARETRAKRNDLRRALLNERQWQQLLEQD